MVWTALLVVLTVSFVSAKKEVIKVPIALRGNRLTGSVYIGNQEYDMSFGMSADDAWVFDKKLKGRLKDSPSFTHNFYTKTRTLRTYDNDPYFESPTFNHNERSHEFTITGQKTFEDFRFEKNAKDSNSFNSIPMGIADTFRNGLKGVVFDHDGRFGLWPWKDDTPGCPMLEWGGILEAYTESCLALFESKGSYLDSLPEKKYSIYLSDSGDSGELVLGGYDASKVEGEVACHPINRFRGLFGYTGSMFEDDDDVAEASWGHTYLSLSTPMFYGKKHLTTGRTGSPIRTVIFDIEVSGVQVPLRTLKTILKKTGAKEMSVMPSITEEDEQHSGTNAKDLGYFISCSSRTRMDHIKFLMGTGATVSLTGHDLFIPSKVNPGWCKMVISPLPPPLAKHAVLVLGDVFFKKYVTILDLEAGRGRTSLCVGTAKHASAAAKVVEGGGGGAEIIDGRTKYARRLGRC